MPGDLVRVRFPKHPFARYRVGQYVFLNFPSFSLLEWHPFTLSSSPGEPYCEVHIKSLGDHTEGLVAVARDETKSLLVRSDGPYGVLSLDYTRYPVLMLFGGGVGVTPMIALLRSVYQFNAPTSKRQRQRKRAADAARGHVKHIYFHWTCSDETTYAWFRGTVHKLLQLSTTQPGAPTLTVRVYVTRATTVSDPSLMQAGRPDVAAAFQAVCDAHEDAAGVAVFACGPRGLVDDAWDQCSRRNAPGRVWDFHHETFEF